MRSFSPNIPFRKVFKVEGPGHNFKILAGELQGKEILMGKYRRTE